MEVIIVIQIWIHQRVNLLEHQKKYINTHIHRLSNYHPRKMNRILIYIESQTRLSSNENMKRNEIKILGICNIHSLIQHNC